MTASIRISGEPGGRGSFAVPSASMPGESWPVEWVSATACWCGCPAFQRKQACRHVEQVARAIAAEARELVARTTPEQRARSASRLTRLEEMFSR